MVHSRADSLDGSAVLVAQEIISDAFAKGLFIALAESITAGLVCSKLVDAPGSSKVVLGGINAYQDQIKTQTLGVSPSLLQMQSAVDPEVAAQMASGVRTKFASAMNLDEARVIGFSTTGVAGPDAVGLHEVGEVYLAISSERGTKVFAEHFSGTRFEIRQACLDRALLLLREEIGLF